MKYFFYGLFLIFSNYAFASLDRDLQDTVEPRMHHHVYWQYHNEYRGKRLQFVLDSENIEFLIIVNSCGLCSNPEGPIILTEEQKEEFYSKVQAANIPGIYHKALMEDLYFPEIDDLWLPEWASRKRLRERGKNTFSNQKRMLIEKASEVHKDAEEHFNQIVHDERVDSAEVQHPQIITITNDDEGNVIEDDQEQLNNGSVALQDPQIINITNDTLDNKSVTKPVSKKKRRRGKKASKIPANNSKWLLSESKSLSEPQKKRKRDPEEKVVYQVKVIEENNLIETMNGVEHIMPSPHQHWKPRDDKDVFPMIECIEINNDEWMDVNSKKSKEHSYVQITAYAMNDKVKEGMSYNWSKVRKILNILAKENVDQFLQNNHKDNGDRRGNGLNFHKLEGDLKKWSAVDIDQYNRFIFNILSYYPNGSAKKIEILSTMGHYEEEYTEGDKAFWLMKEPIDWRDISIQQLAEQ